MTPSLNNLEHRLLPVYTWFRATLAVFFVFVYLIPFIAFVLLVLLRLSRNSDPGSHGRLVSPLPTTVPVHFYREKTSALSSLVDSRRIVPTHAIIGALDNWCHLRKKKLHTEIATYGINAGGVRG